MASDLKALGAVALPVLAAAPALVSGLTWTPFKGPLRPIRMFVLVTRASGREGFHLLCLPDRQLLCSSGFGVPGGFSHTRHYVSDKWPARNRSDWTHQLGTVCWGQGRQRDHRLVARRGHVLSCFSVGRDMQQVSMIEGIFPAYSSSGGRTS